MYWELFIAIIGISLLIIFINITDCFIKFRGLIKGGKILEYFPSWGGDKKTAFMVHYLEYSRISRSTTIYSCCSIEWFY